MGKYGAEAYRAMYPEESFMAVNQEVGESRWMDEECLWNKQESSVRGSERVGWRCEACSFCYWVKVIEFEDWREEYKLARSVTMHY
jgi:hypothetical protein